MVSFDSSLFNHSTVQLSKSLTSLSVTVVVATSSPLFSSCPFSSSQARRSATKACFSSNRPSASKGARRMRGLGVGSGTVVICRAAAVTRVGVTVAFLSFWVARCGKLQVLVMVLVLTTGMAV